MSGTPDYLAMSDEELLNAPPPDVAVAPAAAEASVDESATGEASESAVVAPSKDDAGDDEVDDAKGGAPAEGGTPEAGAKPAGSDVAEKGGDEKPPKVEAPASEAKPPEAALDYEAEHKRLLAPFKANGRQMQVHSVDEAISLMQMGANYNKQMSALKPNLKFVKMLEKHDLLSEEKLSFLIDLGKKDPAAINKLVKDSGIDPLDLTAEKAAAYTQSSHAVDDREVDLDTVLESLQDSKTYTQTLDVVSNKWDAASKRIVAQHPQLLTVLDDHMASGIYDLISTEVERERVFGRLSGLSDIEAYRQVGDAIQARGGFSNLGSAQPAPKPALGEEVAPNPKPDDSKRADKRRAASTATPIAPSTGVATEGTSPLAMSDAEFEALINKRRG